VFVIKTFYCSIGSCLAVWRQYRWQFSVRATPPKDIIYRTVKQFDETGSACDKRVNRCKRSVSILFIRHKEVFVIPEADCTGIYG
jgi:hypothetical protein